jgi:ankyrin repeat protein
VPENPFFCAVAKGDEKMFELVCLNKTINIHQTSDGVNAFWLACLLGHGNIMSILAERGIDIFCTNSQKTNALHLAVIKHHTHVVFMLLESDFPVHRKNQDGNTAFHLAVLNGFYDIVLLMVDFF